MKRLPDGRSWLTGRSCPLRKATNVHASLPYRWIFDYAPGWTAGQQVVVSIRTKDVQNRVGRVVFQGERRVSRREGPPRFKGVAVRLQLYPARPPGTTGP